MSPVMPLYLASLRFPAVGIGLLFSIWGVGTILFEPAIGILADKGRRGAMMYALCLGTCALYVLFTLAGSFLAFAVLQFLLGGMFAGAAVLFRYAIPSVISPDRPSAAYGLLGSAWSGAATFGSLAGGFILSASGYGLPFYLASTAAALAVAPLWLSGLGRVAHRQISSSEEPDLSGGRRFELALMGGMAMSAFLIFSVVVTMLPLVVSAAPFNSGPVGVGVLLAIFNGSLLLFQPVVGRVGASRPRTWMAVGLLTAIVSFLLLVGSKSMATAFGSVILAGVAFSAISTHSLARFTTLVHASRRGAAIGIYGAAEDVGVIAGPIVFSVIWTAASLDGALIATSAVLLAVLLACVLPMSLRTQRVIAAGQSRAG